MLGFADTWGVDLIPAPCRVGSARRFGTLQLPLLAIAVCLGTSAHAANAPSPLADTAPTAIPAVAPGLRLSGLAFSAGIDLTETYTSNASGLSGESSSDFLTTIGFFAQASNHTARFDGDLQYRIVADIYAKNSSYTSVYNYLTAAGTAELIPEHFFLRGTLFASPMLINSLGPLSADGRPGGRGPNSGLRDTYGYALSPILVFRLGDFASSETVLTQSGVLFADSDDTTAGPPVPGHSEPSDTVNYSAIERIRSGTDFTRLNWVLTGTWAQSNFQGNDLTQQSGILDAQYALNQTVAIHGTVGYESYTSDHPLSEDLDGWMALGGLNLTLGPRLRADFQAGRRFDSPSYAGDIHYQLGALTSVSASYSDSVGTSAGRLLDRSGLLGVNDQGQFTDTSYGLGPGALPAGSGDLVGFNPGPIDGIGLTNDIQRFRSFSLSALRLGERTQYRLSGFRTVAEALSVTGPSTLPRTEATGGELRVSRTMTPRLTGDWGLRYSNNEILQGDYSIISTDANLGYAVSPVMNAFFHAAYLHRSSDSSLVAVSPLSQDLSDVRISVGLRYTL
jgi:uncharacterized protein (PEP-CTERM system associated)